jgi:inosine/xanthosine triphosphatase
MVVASPIYTAKAQSAVCQLPPKVIALVQQGMELGDADDIVFGQTNSKQQMGAMGLLTH